MQSQNKTKPKLHFFLKIAKNSNFEILHTTLHATHLRKLLDKMYKYEMKPTRTVGPTGLTRDVGRMDGQSDGQTDQRTEWNQYTPQQLCCAGGIIILLHPRNIQGIFYIWFTPTGNLSGKVLAMIFAHMSCQSYVQWQQPVTLQNHYLAWWGSGNWPGAKT